MTASEPSRREGGGGGGRGRLTAKDVIEEGVWEGLEEREKKRQDVMYETVETEKKYVLLFIFVNFIIFFLYSHNCVFSFFPPLLLIPLLFSHLFSSFFSFPSPRYVEDLKTFVEHVGNPLQEQGLVSQTKQLLGLLGTLSSIISINEVK